MFELIVSHQFFWPMFTMFMGAMLLATVLYMPCEPGEKWVYHLIDAELVLFIMGLAGWLLESIFLAIASS